MIALLIELAERGWLPDAAIRAGIRQLLRTRLKELARVGDPEPAEARLAEQLRTAPLTVHATEANDQHYEVPAPFFQLSLGPHLKYSCGLWPDERTTLEQSEQAMLQATVERAGLRDGQSILELGCGWGSLSLFMARQFPGSQVTAVSNSHSQREFIEARARERGITNLRIITADIANFDTPDRFDRVVSVEMFEHVRNHRELFHRIARWLRPGGQLFVHIFCHRSTTYLFETQGAANWMGRHFFTGGMMPSAQWLARFQQELRLVESWEVNGRHYQKTCEAWLVELDKHRPAVDRLFAAQFPPAEARRQAQRWRMFYLSCAELFGFRDGKEWFVIHLRFEKTA